MTTTLMVFQAVVSVLLIITVLLQFGKGAEAGLMGGGSESVFTGSQQGNILSKITILLSVLFLGNSVLLAKLQSSKSGSSLLETAAPISAPAIPGAQNPLAAPEAPKATPAKKEETKK